jgi:magnesium transporter
MLVIYIAEDTGITSIEITQKNKNLLAQALWIDLLCPSQEEEDIIEEYFKLEIPTKIEMEEIEPSSRLYTENNAFYMTASMIAHSDLPEPIVEPVTFILTENKLFTVRYIEPHSFKVFISQIKRASLGKYDAENLLVILLEITTDRLADILEKVSHKFDEISHLIFHKNGNNSGSNVINYKQLLQTIGSNCVLGTKTRDSLISFIRLVSFLEQKSKTKNNIPRGLPRTQSNEGLLGERGAVLSPNRARRSTAHAKYDQLNPEILSRLAVVSKDLSALSDYSVYISAEVNFLLDATLGMINIEQNNIIKIFSVAAVIFLPPTLIASLYGMNFEHMPELRWNLGYPLSLLLMVLSAWLPYRFFKRKKWL